MKNYTKQDIDVLIHDTVVRTMHKYQLTDCCGLLCSVANHTVTQNLPQMAIYPVDTVAKLLNKVQQELETYICESMQCKIKE